MTQPEIRWHDIDRIEIHVRGANERKAAWRQKWPLALKLTDAANKLKLAVDH